MIRVIFFLVLVAAIALGVAWLADRPGDITITWMGWRIETSVMVGLASVALLVALLMLLLSALRLLLRSPRLIAQTARERRRRRGQRAISNGLIAVASGDTRAARRAAGEALRLADQEPLGLLLRAQSAQLAGDRAQADSAFRAMADRPETRLLGLRGLYVEAQRRGDAEAGRRYAEEAARSAPALPWAGQAVFDFRTAAGDWKGALLALDAMLRSSLVDRPTYRRHRAVLLTAQALSAEDSNTAAARPLVQEAIKLAPDLVPAVALAARLSAEAGETRRAARMIEAAWPASPHPDLAEIYVHLRSGDSARDRLARARELARLSPGHREGALVLARAAIDAREFATARSALEPLLRQPTPRVAILMAELEEVEHEDSGRAREWMTRALRLRGDPRWTADGVVSDQWLPLSPVTGRIDAFVWTVPPNEVAAIASSVTAEPEAVARNVTPAALARPERERPAADTEVQPAAEPAAPEPVPSEPAQAMATVTAPESRSPAPSSPAPAQMPPQPAPTAPPVPQPPRPAARREAILPLMHAPDDPGPEPDAASEAAAGNIKRF